MKMKTWLAFLVAWAVSFLLARLGVQLGILGVVLVPFIAIALAIASWRWKLDAKSKEDAEDFGIDLAYSHLEGETGIAVDPELQVIRLRSGHGTRHQVTKEYLFHQLRHVERVLIEGGEIYGSHSAVNMQAAVGASLANLGIAAQNRRIRRENAKRSGLFISVKDIDQPIWQVKFSDPGMMDRWMEILRQATGN